MYGELMDRTGADNAATKTTARVLAAASTHKFSEAGRASLRRYAASDLVRAEQPFMGEIPIHDTIRVVQPLRDLSDLHTWGLCVCVNCSVTLIGGRVAVIVWLSGATQRRCCNCRKVGTLGQQFYTIYALDAQVRNACRLPAGVIT
jgi:hypothetical protein